MPRTLRETAALVSLAAAPLVVPSALSGRRAQPRSAAVASRGPPALAQQCKVSG